MLTIFQALIVPAAFETLADTEDAQAPDQLVGPQNVPDEGHLPIILHLHSASSRLPPGPYVIHRLTGTVLAVARLYHDYYKAFVKNSQGLFCPFTVKVPSRLYYTRTSKKPLAGVSAP